jgi:hypothetical protein
VKRAHENLTTRQYRAKLPAPYANDSQVRRTASHGFQGGVSAIDASIPEVHAAKPLRSLRAGRTIRALVGVLAVALAMCLVPALALAGQASSGQLLYYPCTSCHPVHLIPGTKTPTRRLPNGFTGHGIVLEGHDKLGAGGAACLACHDDPTRNPGKLKTAEGTLIDITGDTALVCYRCHSTKYKEWKAGTHGKHKPSCVAAGCHDPHTPRSIYAAPLMPFVGTGFQFRILPVREPFSPLAPPAPSPPVTVPPWFVVLSVVAVVVAGGLAGGLVTGRSQR